MKTPKKYKIVGYFRHSTLESAQSFDSKEAAAKENKRWKTRASERGEIWQGRIVEIKDQ